MGSRGECSRVLTEVAILTLESLRFSSLRASRKFDIGECLVNREKAKVIRARSISNRTQGRLSKTTFKLRV